MNVKRLLPILAALLSLAGCDPNPNAPTAPASNEPGKLQPSDTKGKAPLKGVGQPLN